MLGGRERISGYYSTRLVIINKLCFQPNRPLYGLKSAGTALIDIKPSHSAFNFHKYSYNTSLICVVTYLYILYRENPCFIHLKRCKLLRTTHLIYRSLRSTPFCPISIYYNSKLKNRSLGYYTAAILVNRNIKYSNHPYTSRKSALYSAVSGA